MPNGIERRRAPNVAHKIVDRDLSPLEETLCKRIGVTNIAKKACAFSQQNLQKIKITQPPVVTSALKPSQVGFDMYRFGWCKREVQENSVA